MADVHDPITRSRNMAAIRGKNTRPEMIVRQALHAKGFRYKLHDKSLPGKPDIVLPRYKAVVFVNGCFFHGHDCHLFKWPEKDSAFWHHKIQGNKARDSRNEEKLRDAGWRIMKIWECALKGPYRLGVESAVTTVEDWIKSCALTGEVRCCNADQ